jgi:integrase
MTVWSPAELASFLTAIEGNRNEALFRLLAMTGLRWGEAVGLRWSDVQLDRHRLTVNQTATVVGGDEVLDTPRSRRSRRVIDLDPDTTALLQRHRTRQRELHLRLGVSASASDRVFTNAIGDPTRPDSIGQAFSRLVASAGRAEDPTPRPAPHPCVAPSARRSELCS